MRTTKKKGLAWLAGVSCVCILASVFVASADPGGPLARSVGVAVLDADAKPASVADVWVISHGPDEATKIRAELVADSTWHFQNSKTDLKVEVYFERSDGGVAMAEVLLPESAEILITAQLDGKDVQCTIGVPAIGPATIAASAPAKFEFATPAFEAAPAFSGGEKDFELRQGGDTCALAVDISGPLPISVTGTTSGYADDYDEVCPYTGSTAPDVVYLYTPTSDVTVDMTLCLGNTNYDTKMYIYAGTCPDPGNPFACNDDACTSAAGQSYVSALPGLMLSGGVDYYIVIDGYGTNSGTYYLDITEVVPECPVNTLYGQERHGAADAWTGATSDTSPALIRYDNFSGVAGAICDLHFWGFDRYFDGVSWGECDEDPMTMLVTFYNDNAGMPGTVACGPYTVTPTRTYVEDYSGRDLWYYETDLSPCCSLSDGWISIQGDQGDTCWLLWMSSPMGDGSSLLWDGTAWTTEVFDLSMCLTGALEPGACCDILTGDCDDGVEQENCVGGRFEPGVLCADLDPPCGSPGACCYDDIPDCDDNVFAANCTDGRHEVGVLCADLDPPCGGLWGACCDAETGECTEMSDEDCTAGGDLYLGDMIPCDPNPCPCVVPCPPGGTPEVEPCDLPGGNDGCSSDPVVPTAVEPIVCGETKCGTIWSDLSLRDLDWYEITTTETLILNWTIEAEFPVYGWVIDAGALDCVTYTILTSGGEPTECTPLTLSTACVPPGTYWLVVGIDDWYDWPCDSNNDYTATLTCDSCAIPTGACCASDGSCAETYEDSCTGYYWGDYTLCADVSCTGACCAPDGSCTDTSEDACYDSFYGIGTDCATTVCPVAPENDECVNAEELGALPATAVMNNALATNDIVEPCGVYSGPSKNLWYKVAGTGNLMTATTCNALTSMDTKISVFCGECDGLICVDGNDDDWDCSYSYRSTVEWCSQVGATYYITVGCYSDYTTPGPIQLDVFESGGACEPDVQCLPLGGCCLDDGTCVVQTEIGCGMLGGWYQGDDTDCTGAPAGDPCTDPDATINVYIECDTFGSETSWELIEQGVGVIASGSGYSGYEIVNVDVAVCSTSCYDFVIYDSYGDGIYSPGGYAVSYEGVLVASTIGAGWYGDLETVADIGGGCGGVESYLGACCIGVPGDYSCVITTEACCDYVDGLFHGYGTNCGEVQVELVSADFNAGLPADWTTAIDVGPFGWVTNDVAGRTNYAGGDGLCMISDVDEYGGSGIDYDLSLITPAFTVMPGCTLEYDAAYNYLSSEQAEVNITINGGTSWINLLTWMEDHDDYGPGEHVVLDLSGYVGETAQIAFRHVGTGWDWYYEVDNVLISAWVIEDDPCLWPALDIKPGSCPNSFNRGSHGVLPVALAADDEFDAYAVDVSTLSIARADGIGGSIGPHEGPPGPHTVVDDVATLFFGEMCECIEAEGDGLMDVSMKFKTDDLVEALQMNDLDSGALVELVLTGNLLDGRPFRASDCVRLVPPGTPPGMLTLQSNAGGAWVNITPLDEQLDGGGFAGFMRTYPQGTSVTITASPTHEGKKFKRWVVDGIPQAVGNPTIQRTVTGVNHNIVARYKRTSGLDPFPDQQNTPLLP